MRLSIIVLTYNQSRFTTRLAETLRPWLAANVDSELIIVDNGSTDSTRRDVYAIPSFPLSQLTYITNDSNIGVARGRNVGLKKARGRYILILDNDTEVTAEALDALLNHIETHPECGLCAPALYSPDGGLQDSAKPFPGLWVKISHILHPGKRLKSEIEAMNSPHPFYVIGACQLFRKSLVDQLGLLDERIFYGPEDADWCLRISKAGMSIDYLPQIQIIHHWQRATHHSPLSRLSRIHFRALLYFYRKHHRYFR